MGNPRSLVLFWLYLRRWLEGEWWELEVNPITGSWHPLSKVNRGQGFAIAFLPREKI